MARVERDPALLYRTSVRRPMSDPWGDGMSSSGGWDSHEAPVQRRGGIMGVVDSMLDRARENQMGKGRGTPAKRQLPFIRHTNIQILVGGGADTEEAKDAAIAAFDTWKKAAENERYRLLELRFEFPAETTVALCIIYSE